MFVVHWDSDPVMTLNENVLVESRIIFSTNLILIKSINFGRNSVGSGWIKLAITKDSNLLVVVHVVDRSRTVISPPPL